MRCSFFLLVAILFSLGVSYAQEARIPSSARSRSVIKRIGPRLKAHVSERGFTYGAPIFMRIIKSEKTLEVFLKKGERFLLFEKYPICTFSGKLGPKLRVGDLQAPEGFYFVRPRQLNPSSRFHLSFNLGYPNAYDRAYRPHRKCADGARQLCFHWLLRDDRCKD